MSPFGRLALLFKTTSTKNFMFSTLSTLVRTLGDRMASYQCYFLLDRHTWMKLRALRVQELLRVIPQLLPTDSVLFLNNIIFLHTLPKLR